MSDALIRHHSRRSVGEVLQLVVAAAEASGLTIFAIIDHSAAAAGVALSMPDTVVILLGSPLLGTPLMLISPDLALELPLRVLVRASETGCDVLLADPEVLLSHYGFDQPRAHQLDGLPKLIREVLDEGSPSAALP